MCPGLIMKKSQIKKSLLGAIQTNKTPYCVCAALCILSNSTYSNCILIAAAAGTNSRHLIVDLSQLFISRISHSKIHPDIN
jgi:hypothetical protein